MLNLSNDCAYPMNKKIIPAVIFLMSISLIGIIGVQVYWLQHAFRAKAEAFDRRVNEALSQLADKIETREAVDVITENLQTTSAAPTEVSVPTTAIPRPKTAKNISAARQEEIFLSKINTARVDLKKQSIQLPKRYRDLPTDTLRIYPHREQFRRPLTRQLIEIQNNVKTSVPLLPNADRLLRDTVVFRKLLALHRIMDTLALTDPARSQPYLRLLPDSSRLLSFRSDSIRQQLAPGRRIWFDKTITRALPADSAAIYPELYFYLRRTPPPTQRYLSQTTTPENIPAPDNSSRKKLINLAPDTNLQEKQVRLKTEKITNVIKRMTVEYIQKNIPLERRLATLPLARLIQNELADKGIDLPFEYAVITGSQPRLTSLHSAGFRPQDTGSQHRINLFPRDIMAKAGYLTVHFKDKEQYVFRSLQWMWVYSGIFVLIIVLTFGSTIYIILRQKKISEVKNDFINNMTHEFKTPLATISLAVDAINNPRVLDNPARVQHFSGIIQEENRRLHGQVENVLQMALLEKNELKLNRRPTDIHAVATQALRNLQLHLETRQAAVITHFNATQTLVDADETHLCHALKNLLDNANKYSPDQPQITLSTQNTPAGILISVADQGLGMSKETQQRIFDKFYRVPTGNLHQVKGFGLGLSYVKAIISAHKGQIEVHSELQKGTRFDILLPLLKS
ncbi:MAG: Two-component system sensor histidine kinase [uncultured Adhaeribacter sp.]|uniref:histidine kinase n=1 Tax=uncultured Adhaeribacter sp. TaxID=448109 RepID=A0A6J4HZ53_9BACT|nr:MAG: Two-component system sensor histidine kinase [uncultured Adhaeribacter sp.]